MDKSRSKRNVLSPLKQNSCKQQGCGTYPSKPQRSPVAKGLIDFYKSPPKDIEVWPAPTKPLRDAVIAYKKKYDKLHHPKEHIVCLTLADFELDLEVEKELNGIIEENQQLRELYGEKAMTCLNPDKYTILEDEGKPYIVGKGGFATVYLAQENTSGNLVCLKALTIKTYETRSSKREDMLKECGFLHHGGIILEKDPAFEPTRLQGLMKLKEGSPMTNYYFNLMPVFSFASLLVQNVAVSLPMSHAQYMLWRKEIPLTKAEWGDILHLAVKGALLLNKGGVLHGDYKENNMCIVYKNDGYALSILDFGMSRRFDVKGKSQDEDVVRAMNIVADLTRPADVVGLDLKHTYSFAEPIASRRTCFNRGTILSELRENLDLDINGEPRKNLFSTDCEFAKEVREEKEHHHTCVTKRS